MSYFAPEKNLKITLFLVILQECVQNMYKEWTGLPKREPQPLHFKRRDIATEKLWLNWVTELLRPASGSCSGASRRQVQWKTRLEKAATGSQRPRLTDT